MKLVESTTPERKEHQAGVYQVRIIEVDEGVSAQKATPFLKVTMETLGEDSFKVKHWFYNTEKAVCILKQFLKELGIEESEFEPNDLLGQILEVTLNKDSETGYLEYKTFSAKAVEQVKPKNDEMIGEDEIPF